MQHIYNLTREIIEAACSKFLQAVPVFQELKVTYESIPVKRKTTTTLREQIRKVSNAIKTIRQSLANEVFALNKLCTSLEKADGGQFKFNIDHIPKISAIGDNVYAVALSMANLVDKYLAAPQNNLLIALRRQIKKNEKKSTRKESLECKSFQP